MCVLIDWFRRKANNAACVILSSFFYYSMLLIHIISFVLLLNKKGIFSTKTISANRLMKIILISVDTHARASRCVAHSCGFISLFFRLLLLLRWLINYFSSFHSSSLSSIACRLNGRRSMSIFDFNWEDRRRPRQRPPIIMFFANDDGGAFKVTNIESRSVHVYSLS